MKTYQFREKQMRLLYENGIVITKKKNKKLNRYKNINNKPTANYIIVGEKLAKLLKEKYNWY